MRCSYQICSVRIFSTKGENPNEGGYLVLEHDGGEDGDDEEDAVVERILHRILEGSGVPSGLQVPSFEPG